ncbi:MAG: hypothetical protein ACK5IB_09915 [Qingshengfaniella sp.]
MVEMHETAVGRDVHRMRRGALGRLLSALACAVIPATHGLAQDDSLIPFVARAPLDGASALVREMMGFELAYGPQGFVLGGYNLLNPELAGDFDSDRILPQVDVQPLQGPRLNCRDMACVENALQAGVRFIQPGGKPLDPDQRGGPAFLVTLSRPTALETAYERARQIAYAATGILYPAKRGSLGVIAAVAPASPAYAAGLRAGDDLTRIGDGPANAGSLAGLARRGAPMTLFWRAQGAGREQQAGLVPRVGALGVVDGIVRIGGDDGADGDALPAPFRTLTNDKGLMALVLEQPDLAPEHDRRVAALRILEGWSGNPIARACMVPPIERIDIRTSITMTETNLAGQTRTSLDTSSVAPLFVEARFVPFVHSMSASWSSPETTGPVEAAAARIVQLEGCAGPTVHRLTAGIAALAGIALPARADGMSGGQPAWRQFLAQCYPAYMQAARAEGRNVGDRGAVGLCVCAEYGAAEYGDPDLYRRYRAWSFDGVPQDTLQAIWDRTQNGACSRAGNPLAAELVRRYEIFLHDNGL